MRLYLDTCSLQRPLDNRDQLRIVLEAEAILGVIDMIERGIVELVSSDVLLHETRRNPRAERRDYALAVLATATHFVALNDDIEQRGRAFQLLGLKPFDALHPASAEAGWAEYFCTADDKLLRRAKQMKDLSIKAISPIELAEELQR